MKRLGVAALSALIVVTLGFNLVPAVADEPEPTCADYFDTEHLSEDHRAWFIETLDHTWYPCQKLEPALSETAHQKVFLYTEELDGGALAMTDPDGLWVAVDPEVDAPTLFFKVFLHELGHVDDALVLTDDDRSEIKRIFGDPEGCWLDGCGYEEMIGESFAHAFVRVFSDVNPEQLKCPEPRGCHRFNHPVTWHRVGQITQVLMLGS